jgi:hypothetical protein
MRHSGNKDCEHPEKIHAGNADLRKIWEFFQAGLLFEDKTGFRQHPDIFRRCGKPARTEANGLNPMSLNWESEQGAWAGEIQPPRQNWRNQS